MDESHTNWRNIADAYSFYIKINNASCGIKITGANLLVLHEIIRYSVGYGYSETSNRFGDQLTGTRIANNLSITERSVTRAVKFLEDNNIIMVKRSRKLGDKTKPNVYSLNFKLHEHLQLSFEMPFLRLDGNNSKKNKDKTQPITGSEPIFEDTSTWTLKYVMALTKKQKEENFLTKKIEYDDNLVKNGLDFDVATLNGYIKEEE